MRLEKSTKARGRPLLIFASRTRSGRRPNFAWSTVTGGVAGAELTLQLGGAFTWSKETSDAEGRCTVKSPRGQGLSISVRRDGFLTTRVGTRGGPDEPASFTVPRFAAIEGRVVDLAGKPLPGIQVGRLIAPNYAAGLDKPSDHLEVLPVAGTSRPAVTDSDGRFRLEPRINLDNRSGKFRVWPMAVCLADADAAAGCVSASRPRSRADAV